MKRKWMLTLVAGIALTLMAVGGAQADTITLQLGLHNNEAPVCDPGTEGCPNDGGTYWHFVITPDNNWATFILVHLNLGDEILETSQWIAPQVDQVYVAVPTTALYSDILTTGSWANVTYTGSLPNNPQFVLSHICAPQVPEPATLLLLGSGLFGLGLMRRRRD